MLEVIAANLEDALNAEKGGAHRIELVSNPSQEGLTPKIETIKQIIDSISIPLRVMIRDKNAFSDFNYSELKNMASTVKELSKINVDGIVAGFLKSDGTIDFKALQIVLEYKNDLGVTFHRAFDEVNNYEDSLEELINTGIFDKILTSGRSKKAEDGIKILKKLNSLSGNKISIVAGGSISSMNIKKIKSKTGIREFHVGKAVRKNQNYSNDIIPEKVNELVKLIS